jgi:hypothetical protein
MKLPAKHAQSSGSVMRAAEALRAAAVGFAVRSDGDAPCLRQRSNHPRPCSMRSKTAVLNLLRASRAIATRLLRLVWQGGITWHRRVAVRYSAEYACMAACRVLACVA